MEVLLTLLIFFIATLITYLVYIDIYARRYYKARNIPYFGNSLIVVLYHLLIKRRNVPDLVHLQYAKMKKLEAPITGCYELGQLLYTINDLELMKHFFIKDFDHFVNRRQFGNRNSSSDKIMRKMLIFQTDEKWKDLRSRMSPTFTTGKIKRMFELFLQSSRKLVKYMEDRISEAQNGEINAAEGFSKFTTDIIATSVCGMDSEAFDQKEPSVFERMGSKTQLKVGPKEFVRYTIIAQLPWLAEKLGLTFFDKEMSDFFSIAIKGSIHHRMETGWKGNDFIQLLLEAREGKMKLEEGELDSFEKDAQLKEGVISSSSSSSSSELLDDDGIVSNCILFLLGGTDTTNSLLQFCTYSLALNPEVQGKLRGEIDKMLERNGGEFTYEGLHAMVYLDMVINETLRCYPPSIAVDRECVKDYTFPGTKVTIKKGCGVAIPILGLHYDPTYYPNPEKFDPERFSAENKRKIPTYAFLPFGNGPRNCIGMRFALTEVKLAIAELVHNFSIEPSKSTLIPMKYQNSPILKAENGMWLAFKKIVKQG